MTGEVSHGRIGILLFDVYLVLTDVAHAKDWDIYADEACLLHHSHHDERNRADYY